MREFGRIAYRKNSNDSEVYIVDFFNSYTDVDTSRSTRMKQLFLLFAVVPHFDNAGKMRFLMWFANTLRIQISFSISYRVLDGLKRSSNDHSTEM